MSQFSDDRIVAAMTTIIIFLPVVGQLINCVPFLCIGIATEKSLVSAYLVASRKPSDNCKMKMVAALVPDCSSLKING
jgi:hypothetical protein